VKSKEGSAISYDIEDMFITLWESGFLKDDYGIADIRCEFYSYTTLKNTIKKRDNLIKIRISDMLKDAPYDVIWALIVLLFSKLEQIKPPSEHATTYREYINSRAMQNLIRKKRRERVKKQIVSPKGEHYDLRTSFKRINRKYFEGKMKMPLLSWSRRRTKTRFGHHDAALDTIIISKSLDDPKIPRFLLDYVMFHEMLHIKHKSSFENGRRRMHTKAFSEDEMRFKERKRAEVLLKKISSGMKIGD
jgi:predicted metal-dependent hydrolase